MERAHDFAMELVKRQANEEQQRALRRQSAAHQKRKREWESQHEEDVARLKSEGKADVATALERQGAEQRVNVRLAAILGALTSIAARAGVSNHGCARWILKAMQHMKTIIGISSRSSES